MKPHKEYPMCRVTILNENGIPVTVEVSREIYQVFVDYEREIERILSGREGGIGLAVHLREFPLRPFQREVRLRASAGRQHQHRRSRS